MQNTVVAIEEFGMWFTAIVVRVLNRKGDVLALFPDGSRRELPIDTYVEVPEGIRPVRSPMSEDQFHKYVQGELPTFKPGTAPKPARKPEPDRPKRPVVAPTPPEPPKKDESEDEDEEDKLLDAKGKAPRIPLPGNLVSEFEKIHRTAHLYDRVNKVAAMTWVRNVWRWANTAKFGDQLTEPKFLIMKEVAGKRLRYRGWFAPRFKGFKTIKITPRLFYATDQHAAEVVLHEMCHQAVWDVNGREEYLIESRIQRGHGPRWSKWMRSIGLNPARYDSTSNETYMSNTEKQQAERLRKANAALLSRLTEEGWVPMTAAPREARLRIYRGSDETIRLVVRHKKTEGFSIVEGKITGMTAKKIKVVDPSPAGLLYTLSPKHLTWLYIRP